MTTSGSVAIRPRQRRAAGSLPGRRGPADRGIEWGCERLRAFDQASLRRIDKLASLVGRETTSHQEWS